MAKNYYDLIQHCQTLRDDLVVVFITHLDNYGTEIDPDYRLWTTGKYFASITPNSVNPKIIMVIMGIPSQAENIYFIFGRV